MESIAKYTDASNVPFVSVENMVRLVNSIGPAAFIKELAQQIESDFKRWDEFDKIPRVANHCEQGVIELMPTADREFYGCKYVNGHPKNTKEGYQTVTAFGFFSGKDNGYPLLLTEMTLLTGLRTAAMSALVGSYLAPKGAKTMGMIGNGAQCEFQAIGFRELCGINSLRLYDIEPRATEKARKNLEAIGFDITTCDSPEEAVEGVDIVTTCTADKKCATILTDNMVGSGMHINAIGGDCPGKTELHKDILLRSDIFVEFPEQTRIEGEIQQLSDDYPVTELWEVMRGDKAGRSNDKQITLFDSVGFAVEDFSALRYVYEKVKGTEFVENLNLCADPEDPRDLFGLLDCKSPKI
jgi:ornithine cyclodeaminase